MANTLGLSHWTVVQNGARKITCMLVEPPWLLLTGLSLLPIALREYKKQTTKQTKWLRDAKLFWTFLTISNSAIVFAEQLKPNIFWFFQFWGPIVAIFFGKSLENYYHRQKMLVFKLTIMMRLFLLDHRGRLFCNVCRPSLTIIPMVVNRRSNDAMLTMHRWSLPPDISPNESRETKTTAVNRVRLSPPLHTSLQLLSALHALHAPCSVNCTLHTLLLLYQLHTMHTPLRVHCKQHTAISAAQCTHLALDTALQLHIALKS